MNKLTGRFRKEGLIQGLLLWCLGMVGVITLTATFIPDLLAGQDIPLPLWVIVLVSSLQTAVLLAVAVWIGCGSSPKVGLSSPLILAIVKGQSWSTVLARQWRFGLLVGVLGGLGLAGFNWLSPKVMGSGQLMNSGLPEIPLLARVLYGGITEEILIRWGLMSGLLWAIWKLAQRGQGIVEKRWVWLAIWISALLFGAGHLPYVATALPELTWDIVSFIVLANTGFGVLFGYLYWQRGLESAMIAHAGAHIVAFGLSALL